MSVYIGPGQQQGAGSCSADILDWHGVDVKAEPMDFSLAAFSTATDDKYLEEVVNRDLCEYSQSTEQQYSRCSSVLIECDSSPHSEQPCTGASQSQPASVPDSIGGLLISDDPRVVDQLQNSMVSPRCVTSSSVHSMPLLPPALVHGDHGAVDDHPQEPSADPQAAASFSLNESNSADSLNTLSSSLASETVEAKAQSPTDSPLPSGHLSGSRPHVLPPCKVCAAPATGFHYGANTCEACKGFFRRSLLRKETYTCLKNAKCIIRPGKRNLCAACRYDRCLSAGMSKEGIKTGRYTYEKRTRDILEVKQLHTHEAQQRVLSQQEQLAEQYEELISQVMQAQERNHTEAATTNPMISDIHKAYLSKKKSQETGSDTLSYNEFMEVYKATGIEMDDRRQVMEAWIATAERGLCQIVTFAKELPGFASLPLNDQIVLLKNSVVEAWVITRHKAFNVEHACYTAHCGFTFDIHKAFDKEFVEVLLNVVRRLQQLELTAADTCILKAMVFFFSDRCELEAPSQVDALQAKLVDTLCYLIRRTHSGKRHMLARIMLILTELRTLTKMYHVQNEKVLSWTDIKRAPLIWEVMSTNSPEQRHRATTAAAVDSATSATAASAAASAAAASCPSRPDQPFLSASTSAESIRDESMASAAIGGDLHCLKRCSEQ